MLDRVRNTSASSWADLRCTFPLLPGISSGAGSRIREGPRWRALPARDRREAGSRIHGRRGATATQMSSSTTTSTPTHPRTRPSDQPRL
nr:hypothetical protein CFP56_28619 [Quercus suber]